MAGFVLRLAREAAPLTQDRLAQELGVDTGTVQGWESGRRPLANVKAGRLLELRRRLPALAGRLPPARRGPAPVSPALPAGLRGTVFTHLREATERALRQGEAGALLHRQALYLASYDRGGEAAAWTRAALHRGRDGLARRGFSPRWAGARSTATALARQGDPQPLLDFIDRALADDDVAEAANLNY
ncbi:helix-turn-helix transcriptional regulator [Streptomyces sp. NPDC126503]|uniref:helix-turn-helix domain-containing protein n=1 Tax=Streptomyces sp. NPDC126503 TaxID=3155315 RepID=UPI00332E2BF8